MLGRMIRRLALVALVLTVVGWPLAGCSRQVSIDTPVRITAEEYDRVFESAADVLEYELYEIDRKDRRFGVIKTRPLWAGSALEPWRTDNTTAYQYVDSTMNHHRRTVTVLLMPQPAPDAGDAPPADAVVDADDYQLEVQVLVERRQLQPRELNTAAASSVSYYGRSGGARRIVTERGVETQYWRAVGRDEFLEQRLVNRILARASVVRATHSSEEAETEPQVIPELQ